MVAAVAKAVRWSAAALLLTVWAHAGSARCGAPLPAQIPTDAPKRSATSAELIRLRDIGPSEVIFGMPSPLALSPDRASAAFILTRAEPATNEYCRALIVLDLSGRAPPRELDRGGQHITQRDAYRGYFVNGGVPALVVPAWSPDGATVAYLRRDRGVTQIWLVRSDGGGAKPVTRSAVDIEDLAWGSDGKTIIFASRPGLLQEAMRIDAAGRSGWLYDASIAPDYGPRPQIPSTVDRELFALDLTTGATRPASAEQRMLIEPETPAGTPKAAKARTADGREVKTRLRDASPLSATDIVVSGVKSDPIICASDVCASGIQNLWWSKDETSLLILRREGWNNSQMALYRWVPGRSEPRRLFATDDALLGCHHLKPGLLCLSENATAPRRIVLIDPDNGRSRLLFDPNPEIAAWQFGQVRRLRWKNHLGLQAHGDLVLPPDYKPGTKVPLVVVQYHSDGFLRGGTGDEYPIYPLAAQGFAVLSFDRPTYFAAAYPNLKSWDEINAANQKDWAERRSLLSAILAGVNQALASGAIDRHRIGITGLSDGASSARFALINSRVFATAAISTCCIEPKTVMTYGGIAWADSLRKMGYPPASREDLSFWKPYSMAMNAKAMRTPLLMQLADSEYLLSLETFTALREHEQPVEMYVYPEEYHIKAQPEHRLAVYDRNVDWFNFWLQGREDPASAKAGQYLRWRAMRERAFSGSAPAAR